ncbi:MAG: methylenetetrahydrofolate reductase [Enterococcaceae bacterium]|jgi:methylenetetrahydrofolate reductase (NADPH)|nr:methylenetetrahydrofolate reductase [Enterococcaceae bacterium]MCI1919395.1 methylenetetrahydrofolate reductase [Enterococcaceae bacterium]
MKISELYQEKRPVFSFEIFPPKKEQGIGVLYQTLDELRHYAPDFISVTYGAGGAGVHSKTREIAEKIQNDFHVPALHHLTGINSTKAEMTERLAVLKAAGIENILALRGDRVPGMAPSQDFLHATELIAAIHQDPAFSIGAACYPEGHIEELATCENGRHLKAKADAGADFFISQLFFQNDSFYRLQEVAEQAQVARPISAGIMPLTNKDQLQRMIFMCGASLPAELIKLIYRYEDDPASLKAAGIEYAIKQIEDLLKHGVDGIHLYAMNQSEFVKAVFEAVKK